jgi:hypothetical protein
MRPIDKRRGDPAGSTLWVSPSALRGPDVQSTEHLTDTGRSERFFKIARALSGRFGQQAPQLDSVDD